MVTAHKAKKRHSAAYEPSYRFQHTHRDRLQNIPAAPHKETKQAEQTALLAALNSAAPLPLKEEQQRLGLMRQTGCVTGTE